MAMHKRRLKTLADLRRYLANALNKFENGEIVESHLKAVAYVSNVMAGIIKDSDLEARVAALEAQSKNKEGKA